jgi:hypothetical protein
MLSAMAVPLWRVRGAGVRSDFDFREAQDATMAHVPWPKHFQDRSRGSCSGTRHFRCLHQGRIEWLPQTRDFLHIEAPKQIIKALTRQEIAVDQRREDVTLGKTCQKTVQSGETPLCFLHTATEAVPHF